MEMCDIIRKSVLKKSGPSILNKSKKVTFCRTVKVFIDEINLDKKVDAIDPQSDCFEVNIVDKSSDDSVIITDISKNDDCNATDFLVHKVFYDNEADGESDIDALSEDAEDSLILFNTSNEEEGLQFVVHKVTEHEDDLIQQERELDDNDKNVNISNNLEGSDDFVNKLSELSIENILNHDKIIAFIDQKSLGLASILKNHVNLSEINSLSLLKDPFKDAVDCLKDTPCLENSELVLSPPLQELSLDKIVKAQSNNVLSELDISPLNSIQETDSESDVSSEGTMIMMTTEESEKNEQHIKESFLKYQSIKKQQNHTKDLIFTNVQISNVNMEKQFIEEETIQNTSAPNLLEEFNSDNKETLTNCEKDMLKKAALSATVNYNTEQWQPEFLKKTRSASVPNNSKAHSYQDFNNVNVHEGRRVSFNGVNTSCSDKSLEFVKIPKDVREWKITKSSIDKNFKDYSNNNSNFNSHLLSKNECIESKTACLQNLSETDTEVSPKADELESFVHASTERVQRIRKRYLDKSTKKIGTAAGSIRGIRPRFCSTAEILHMLEKKNQPPLLTLSYRNHVSWPWDNSISNSENIRNKEQFSHMLGCQVLSGEYSLQTSFSSYVSEDSNSSTCDHDSVSSCPSIFFHERGNPEGASPPRSLSSDSIEKYSNEEGPSNVVYFSMKV